MPNISRKKSPAKPINTPFPGKTASALSAGSSKFRTSDELDDDEVSLDFSASQASLFLFGGEAGLDKLAKKKIPVRCGMTKKAESAKGDDEDDEISINLNPSQASEFLFGGESGLEKLAKQDVPVRRGKKAKPVKGKEGEEMKGGNEKETKKENRKPKGYSK